MTKGEIIECILASQGSLPKDVYSTVFEKMMCKPDDELLLSLQKYGLQFYKIGNLFIAKN